MKTLKNLFFTVVFLYSTTGFSMQQQGQLTPRSAKFNSIFQEIAKDVTSLLDNGTKNLSNVATDQSNSAHVQNLANNAQAISKKADQVTNLLAQEKSTDHTQSNAFLDFVGTIEKVAEEVEPIVLQIINNIDQSQQNNHPASQYSSSIAKMKVALTHK